MAVNPVPPGHHTVTPYLLLSDAPGEIDFLKQAFDAVEILRMTGPDGSTMHAQVRIGDSMVMMTDARGMFSVTPSFLYLYMPDVDATYKKAMAAGATSIREPVNEFYGDRCAGVKDPQGNTWWIATHFEDVTPEELEKRRAAMGKS